MPCPKRGIIDITHFTVFPGTQFFTEEISMRARGNVCIVSVCLAVQPAASPENGSDADGNAVQVGVHQHNTLTCPILRSN